ncbi:MAG: exodeoxyribonuclease VII small subunit [Erysipelotrichaceae bacterium]|nr:exodeoxyribonuclease VII small subunit [Erysipelotrichaceae bacterium]
MSSENNKVPFEERLKRLEVIVTKLEKGEEPLEDSLTLFEEGIELLKSLEDELGNAKARVERVLKGEKGE